jgi:RNA polymerase sigma factor (sigma-70 family)
MHRPYAHRQIAFETLYCTYWEPVVRFCSKRLTSLPDGTAEEIAQDVFLVAHKAMEQQLYRGESPISTWLFGIARNLCHKARRETHRKTTAYTLRHLEREIAQLEQEVAHLASENSPRAHALVHLIRERLTLARVGLERERAQLQRYIIASVHSTPPAPLDAPLLTHDPLAVMQDSFQRFARCERQMHALLHMHVVKEAPVQEIAELHGMSRSAVYRGLTRAKAELRQVYQSVTHERQLAPTAD